MKRNKVEMAPIGAQITVGDLARLKELAKKEDLAVSQIIRRAVRRYLDQFDIAEEA